MHGSTTTREYIRRPRTTRTSRQPVTGPSQVLCAENVPSVSNDMHESTTTREYIRRPRTTRTSRQPVTGPSQVLCAEYVPSVSNDMHGSTTTREYIRRLVRLDKSALRVDTSRQYWTTLLLAGRNANAGRGFKSYPTSSWGFFSKGTLSFAFVGRKVARAPLLTFTPQFQGIGNDHCACSLPISYFGLVKAGKDVKVTKFPPPPPPPNTTQGHTPRSLPIA